MNTSNDVAVKSEKERDEALRNLAKSSLEAKTILSNFAGRLRVHRDALLMIRTFYMSFVRKGIPVKKVPFDKVFYDLEALGYGITEKYPNGDLKAFLPEISLKYIGMVSQPIVKPIQNPPTIKQALTVVPLTQAKIGQTVTILFEVNGKKCQAEVPIDSVPQFTAMLNN